MLKFMPMKKKISRNQEIKDNIFSWNSNGQLEKFIFIIKFLLIFILINFFLKLNFES